MLVPDPFEVHTATVWPLSVYEPITKRNETDLLAAKSFLISLECSVYTSYLKLSIFGAVLNEKGPSTSDLIDDLPKSISRTIVSDEVVKLRSHPDIRIARHDQTLARLAQLISERRVQPGLRHVLSVQA